MNMAMRCDYSDYVQDYKIKCTYLIFESLILLTRLELTTAVNSVGLITAEIALFDIN